MAADDTLADTVAGTFTGTVTNNKLMADYTIQDLIKLASEIHNATKLVHNPNYTEFDRSLITNFTKRLYYKFLTGIKRHPTKIHPKIEQLFDFIVLSYDATCKHSLQSLSACINSNNPYDPKIEFISKQSNISMGRVSAWIVGMITPINNDQFMWTWTNAETRQIVEAHLKGAAQTFKVLLQDKVVLTYSRDCYIMCGMFLDAIKKYQSILVYRDDEKNCDYYVVFNSNKIVWEPFSVDLDKTGVIFKTQFKKHCFRCKKECTSMCINCKCIFYCSKQCQLADWPRHQFECNLFVQNGVRLKSRLTTLCREFLQHGKFIEATEIADKEEIKDTTDVISKETTAE
jgi:hypothetical protein